MSKVYKNHKHNYYRKNNNMKKVVFIVMALMLLSFVNASQDSLGVYTQNENADLLQICGTCTYNNITSIVLPNGTHLPLDAQMTRRGAEYNYTFSQTDLLGVYSANGVGNLDGTDNAWAYDFKVTPNGEDPSGLESLGVLLVMVLIASALFLSANFYAKEQVAIKTLLIMFGYGFLLIAAQVGKISVGANNWLSRISSVGVTMMIVIFWIMIVYYLIIYTKTILNKIKDIRNKKKQERFGGWA